MAKKELVCPECNSVNVVWHVEKDSYFECKDCKHKFGRVKGKKKNKSWYAAD